MEALKKSRMNSQDTITQYYQQHHGELLNYVISRLQGATEAEDIVQDVFLRLLSSQQLITTVTLPSLVYTMARHLICDYYRRRKPRKDYEYELQYTAPTVVSCTESLVAIHEVEREVEQCLSRLPSICSEIYHLHLYDNMQVSDISQALGQPYKTVENRLGMARKEVRKRLRNVS